MELFHYLFFLFPIIEIYLNKNYLELFDFGNIKLNN